MNNHFTHQSSKKNSVAEFDSLTATAEGANSCGRVWREDNRSLVKVQAWNFFGQLKVVPKHFFRHKGGSRILARGVHMSDGNAQEDQSLYVRQCIIHAFKRIRAVV